MMIRATAILAAALTLTVLPSPSMAQEDAVRTSPDEDTAPGTIFDGLWTAFDRTYALFGAKRVRWEAVRETYRPRAVAAKSDEELFDVLAETLRLLNDNHVKLTAWDRYLSNAGSLLGERLDDFSVEVVRERYLAAPPTERVDGDLAFGWLPENVAYLHVRGLTDTPETAAAMNEFVAGLGQARGVVVDLRANLGGDDPAGRAVASRLADRPRLYMTTELKTGPGPDDFTAPKPWIVTPPETGSYLGPIVVLTHEFTMSAAEDLLLALRTLPHVTVVGSQTAGAMGDTFHDVLPNGWVFRGVRARTLDAEGRSWEGIGIPPDLWIENTPAEVVRGQDRVLERAMALLLAGGLEPAPHTTDASKPVRRPLAKSLGEWVDHHGLGPAMERFRDARGDAERWFLAEDFADDEDLVALGRRLLEAGRIEAAVAILEAAAEAYPASYRPHRWLARAYGAAGDEVLAEAARQRGLELNPLLYPADREAAVEMRGLIPLAGGFAETAFDEGVERAIAELRATRLKAGERAHVDHLTLLRVGHQLREARQLAEARRVFSFVIEEFPQWAPGHLGLAETLRMLDETEAALGAYRQVLEHDAGNIRARRMIDELSSRAPD